MSKPNKPRNPFTEGKDEKEIWKALLNNSRPISKEKFMKMVGKTK